MAPTKWKTGVITQVYPGKDGHVRISTVKTASGELQRPIVKLVPLYVDHPVKVPEYGQTQGCPRENRNDNGESQLL